MCCICLAQKESIILIASNKGRNSTLEQREERMCLHLIQIQAVKFGSHVAVIFS
jgi:hypothetical protein